MGDKDVEGPKQSIPSRSRSTRQVIAFQPLQLEVKRRLNILRNFEHGTDHHSSIPVPLKDSFSRYFFVTLNMLEARMATTPC